MSEDEIKKIFAKNLNNYLYLNGKTQADLCRYMNVSSATVSNWCTGLKMPRMTKIQAICNWLGVEKSDLLENKNNIQEEKLNTAVTPTEFQHLNKFRSLNPIGQDKAVEYVSDLADNPKYKKAEEIEQVKEEEEPYVPKVMAAHHPTYNYSEEDFQDIDNILKIVAQKKREKGEL